MLNGSFSYEDAGSMEDAIGRAIDKAEAGDVVLLSPGCASFDMFKDFVERGNRFKEIVNRL
jgi:UDP-N-acetylmuramoylalanine--D-glutamate ligase